MGFGTQAYVRWAVSTVRAPGGSLGATAAAVLPVVPAVQLRLSLQLLLSCGECSAAGRRRAQWGTARVADGLKTA